MISTIEISTTREFRMPALYTTISYCNIANYGPQDYLLWHRVIYGNVLRLHKRQELLIGQYVMEGS